jgi:hypothetical protein
LTRMGSRRTIISCRFAANARLIEIGFSTVC